MILRQIMKRIFIYIAAGIMIAGSSILGGCNKGESYADLLKKEEKAVNWYLSGFSVETSIPSDSIFEEGENAPYYKMNSDGTIYMKVLNSGDRNMRPSKGDKVYFRFERMNIRNLYEVGIENWVGNSNDLESGMGSTYFIFDDYTLSSTYQYGQGIQLPMKYLGYNAQVSLILKAQSGFLSEQSSCLPYVMNVRYFKPL